jgi:multiple sugar transport system permease protein
MKKNNELVLDTRGLKKDALSTKAIALLTVRRIIAYLILILLSFMCLFTIYILIINSTRSHTQIMQGFSFLPGSNFVANYHSMINNALPVGQGFINSFIISLSSATLCVYFSALTAYGIHMYNFKLKKIIFTFILVVMMVPGQVGAIGLVKMCYDMGFLDSNSKFIVYIPLILPSVASPVVFFYIKQYLDSILPKEMVEAARVDGAGEFRIFHGMVLPILKPALSIQFIFAFVSSWNNYFVPQLLLANKSSEFKTIPMILALLNDNSNPKNADLGRVYMFMLFAIVPLLIVYLIFSRFIIKNLTSGSVKG